MEYTIPSPCSPSGSSMTQLHDWIRSLPPSSNHVSLELACRLAMHTQGTCISNVRLTLCRIRKSTIITLPFLFIRLSPSSGKGDGLDRPVSYHFFLASCLRPPNIPFCPRRSPRKLERRSMVMSMLTAPRLACAELRIFHLQEHSGNAPVDDGQSLTTLTK